MQHIQMPTEPEPLEALRAPTALLSSFVFFCFWIATFIDGSFGTKFRRSQSLSTFAEESLRFVATAAGVVGKSRGFHRNLTTTVHEAYLRRHKSKRPKPKSEALMQIATDVAVWSTLLKKVRTKPFLQHMPK